MTKAKKFTTYLICFILIILSMGFFGSQNVLSSASAESVEISTLFVRDSSIICNNESYIFVYDDLDGKIKQLDMSEDTVAVNESIAVNSPIDIAASASNLFVLTNDEVKVYNAATLEPVSVENLTETTSFESVESVSLFEKSATEILLLLIPKAEETTLLTLLSINLENSKIESALNISFGQSFLESLSGGINAAYILSEDSGNAQILLQSSSNYYTFSYNISSPHTIDTWTTLSLDSAANNLYVSAIDSETVILTISDTSINYYTYNTSDSPALTSLGTSQITNTSVASAYKNKLVLKLNEAEFKANICTLNKTNTEPFVIELELQKTISNKLFTNEDYDVGAIKYYKLTSEQVCYLSPYSSQGTTLPEGTHVALLSIPTADGADFGYSYCLAVYSGANIFGYIKSSELSSLQATNYPHNYVYVIEGTSLFTLPTNVTGEAEGNSILATISKNDKVRILSPLCDAEMGGRKFLLVEVNGKTGFILEDRVYGKYINYNLVVTNAYLKTGVNVYKDADGNSEVIGKLASGDRLRVIQTRRIDSEYLQVKYNDLDGNEITGYVLASAVETDSWSMLQILGMVLVVINLIFLVIILAVRKKINKD